MGPVGLPEMVAIFVIALLLFGPKKLPELGRMLGKGLSEFRRAKSELKATFETHLQELERETRELKTPLMTSGSNTPDYSSNTPDYSSPRYSYPYEDQGTWETGNSPEVVPTNSYSADRALESAAHEAQGRAPEAAPQALPVAGTVPRRASPLPEEHPA